MIMKKERRIKMTNQELKDFNSVVYKLNPDYCINDRSVFYDGGKGLLLPKLYYDLELSSYDVFTCIDKDDNLFLVTRLQEKDPKTLEYGDGKYIVTMVQIYTVLRLLTGSIKLKDIYYTADAPVISLYQVSETELKACFEENWDKGSILMESSCQNFEPVDIMHQNITELIHRFKEKYGCLPISISYKGTLTTFYEENANSKIYTDEIIVKEVKKEPEESPSMKKLRVAAEKLHHTNKIYSIGRLCKFPLRKTVLFPTLYYCMMFPNDIWVLQSENRLLFILYKVTDSVYAITTLNPEDGIKFLNRELTFGDLFTTRGMKYALLDQRLYGLSGDALHDFHNKFPEESFIPPQFMDYEISLLQKYVKK